MKLLFVKLLTCFWLWRLRKVIKAIDEMTLDVVAGKTLTNNIINLGKLVSKRKFTHHSHGFKYKFLNTVISLKRRDGQYQFSISIKGKVEYHFYPMYEYTYQVIDAYVVEESVMAYYTPKLKAKLDKQYLDWD